MWYLHELFVIYRANYVEINGIRYSNGCVVVLNTSAVIPIFGCVIDVLLTDVDNCLFVCEELQSEEFVEHFHAYKVNREIADAIPLVICKHKEFSDYHVLGLYKHDDSMYVVPKYHLI